MSDSWSFQANTGILVTESRLQTAECGTMVSVPARGRLSAGVGVKDHFPQLMSTRQTGRRRAVEKAAWAAPFWACLAPWLVVSWWFSLWRAGLSHIQHNLRHRYSQRPGRMENQ